MMQIMDSCCRPLQDILNPELFRALADPNRQAILTCLARCGGSQTVGEVACELPVDLSVVSRHLGVLRDAGLLVSEREGKSVRYSICCDEVIVQLRALADALESCCSPPEENRRLSEETSLEKDQRSTAPLSPNRPVRREGGDSE